MINPTTMSTPTIAPTTLVKVLVGASAARLTTGYGSGWRESASSAAPFAITASGSSGRSTGRRNSVRRPALYRRDVRAAADEHESVRLAGGTVQNLRGEGRRRGDDRRGDAVELGPGQLQRCARTEFDRHRILGRQLFLGGPHPRGENVAVGSGGVGLAACQLRRQCGIDSVAAHLGGALRIQHGRIGLIEQGDGEAGGAEVDDRHGLVTRNLAGAVQILQRRRGFRDELQVVTMRGDRGTDRLHLVLATVGHRDPRRPHHPSGDLRGHQLDR